MKWDWIFFDADETLFTFDSFSGLQRMFLDYSVTFTAEDFQDYQAVNKPLWVDYQNGAITSLQLQHQRFDSWAERLNVPPGELNDAFMNAMAEICAPLPGAVSLLNALQGKVRMGIITNGFTSLQQTRLERTGLRDHFDLLIISEQVGVAKPDARIFDYALAQAGNPPRSRVLMVGDTAESDIRGGVNAGLATCWLNAHQRELPADLEFEEFNEIREQLAALIEAQLAVYKEKGIPLDLGLVAREFLAQYPRGRHFDVARIVVDQAVQLGVAQADFTGLPAKWQPINDYGAKVQAHVIDKY